MIKIALFNDWWIPNLVGGAEKSAYDNYCRLVEDGFDVTVFHPKIYPMKYQKNETQIISVPILSFRRRPITSKIIKIIEKIRVFTDPISPLILTLSIRKSKPNLILLHQIDRIGPYFIFYLHLGIPRAKIVRVYHDLGDSCLFRTRYKNEKICKNICLLCKPKNFVNRFESKYIDLAIFNSSFTERQFKHLNYDPKESKVGYPILEVKNISSKLPEIKTVSNLQLGYVGRLHHTKGIEFLMKAVSKTDATLHLVGAGDSKYIEQLQVLANNLKIQIKFHGFQNDPYPLLRQLGVRILVVPSKWAEPFGRIPLEAAHFGLLTLATNSGGLPESMNLFDPPIPTFEYGDVQSLISLLERYRSETVEKTDLRIKPFPTLNSVLLEYISSTEF